MAEALKAIGNCGGKSQLDFLKGITKEKTYPAIVKKAAEQAIEKIK
jgi:uncharacterized protein (UPF0147 family)